MAKKPTKRPTPSERKAMSAGWRSALQESLPPTTPFAEIWALYLARLKSKPTSSYISARTSGSLYLLPAFGEMPVSEITTPQVAAWVATLRSEMAAKTCLSRHAFLRAALELARGRGAIQSNPAARLPPGTLPPNETVPGFDAAAELLTLQEMSRVISAPEIPLYRRLRYALTALTGARLGEVSALRLRHLQADEPLWRLTFERGWVRDRNVEGTTKTRAVRLVPVHPVLLELLNEMQTHGWWALYSVTMQSEDLIAAEPERGTGRPKRLSNALEQWHADLHRLGMRQRRFHSLRHWFVTTLIANFVEERTIRSMTHPSKSGDAFGDYAHTQWSQKCQAILSIKVQLSPPSSTTPPDR